jgi:hypothetical protein
LKGRNAVTQKLAECDRRNIVNITTDQWETARPGTHMVAQEQRALVEGELDRVEVQLDAHEELANGTIDEILHADPELVVVRRAFEPLVDIVAHEDVDQSARRVADDGREA